MLLLLFSSCCWSFISAVVKIWRESATFWLHWVFDLGTQIQNGIRDACSTVSELQSVFFKSVFIQGICLRRVPTYASSKLCKFISCQKVKLLLFISSIWILNLNVCYVFYMSPQRVCLWWQMVPFLLSTLVCASSYVYSKNLGQSRQSHTGHICLIFLHCVFSNVSSKRLHKRMQSHIGCICWTFLHYAFSNVSSNCVHEKMHSHIGCICLI